MTDNLNGLLQEAFAGKIVRKDLTKKIKEGANVPVYVLEYLLGMYCTTDDEASIEAGVERVKGILADNFVRPDEAEKIKSKICELGPRGTGKSHIYKEISPNSILVSGGQTTVANLFYNMSNQCQQVKPSHQQLSF